MFNFSCNNCSILDLLKWISVVLVLVSNLMFGCPLPTFFQFALGGVSLFGLLKQLNFNNMKDNTVWWMGAILESRNLGTN